MRWSPFSHTECSKMESISVFEIIKIGVGSSSSHTMGPWKAAQMFSDLLEKNGTLGTVSHVQVLFYGSLALTGVGHGSDVAVLLGLSGYDYKRIDTSKIPLLIDDIRGSKILRLKGKYEISFSCNDDIIYESRKTLPRHPNGLKFDARFESGAQFPEEYYSVGGGFVLTGNEDYVASEVTRPRYACHNAVSIEQ